MLRKILACAALSPTVIACSPFVQTETRSPQQETVTDAICVDVMGLWTGEVYYPRCLESVTSILGTMEKRQAMVAGYRVCGQQGLEEGTAAFSFCMSDIMSRASAPKPLTIAYPGGPDTEPGKRFDDISPGIQLSRERYACGELGLLPGSGPFEDCVASLEDALIPNKY